MHWLLYEERVSGCLYDTRYLVPGTIAGGVYQVSYIRRYGVFTSMYIQESINSITGDHS